MEYPNQRYYFEVGSLYMKDFTHRFNFDEFARLFPDRFFGLEKLVKYYDEFNAVDIIYHKRGSIKLGVSLCGNNGTLFGEGLWIIPAYFIFTRVVRNYQ